MARRQRQTQDKAHNSYVDVWTLLGLIAGVVGVVVGIPVTVIAWLRPRAPRGIRPSPVAQPQVDVANAFPAYDLPGGGQRLGDHLVSVTTRNPTANRIKVIGWGVHLPNGKNMVVPVPTTSWEARLPAWVEPGDELTVYLDAEEVRGHVRAQGMAYDEMHAYVSLADGRQLVAAGGLPLAD